MASVKQRINNEILKAVKESAIDCKIYSTISKNSENLICYGVDVVKSNQFSSYPSLDDDQAQKEGLDVRKLEWRASKITINGVDYAQRENSNEIYDFNSYMQATQGTTQPILIGRLVDVQGKKKLMRPNVVWPSVVWPNEMLARSIMLKIYLPIKLFKQ